MLWTSCGPADRLCPGGTHEISLLVPWLAWILYDYIQTSKLHTLLTERSYSCSYLGFLYFFKIVTTSVT